LGKKGVAPRCRPQAVPKQALGGNWLRLTRLSIIVWTTNQHAVRLYELYDFTIEGTMEDYVFTDGHHCDAYMMGRLKRD